MRGSTLLISRSAGMVPSAIGAWRRGREAAYTEHVDRRLHAARRTGHLEGHVRARVAGPLPHRLRHVVVGRIPCPQPLLLGEQPTVRAQLHTRTSAPGARATSAMRMPDGAAADHDHLLVLGDLGPAHVVHGDRRRLDEHGPVKGHAVGQPDERRAKKARSTPSIPALN